MHPFHGVHGYFCTRGCNCTRPIALRPTANRTSISSELSSSSLFLRLFRFYFQSRATDVTRRLDLMIAPRNEKHRFSQRLVLAPSSLPPLTPGHWEPSVSLSTMDFRIVVAANGETCFGNLGVFVFWGCNEGIDYEIWRNLDLRVTRRFHF